MQRTPSSIRPHVILLGRRNVGKSSLLNAIAKQPIALVSDVPGTTTDPVKKPYELLPFGPVVFLDTAGLDDIGPLGELRVKRTLEHVKQADVGILVIEAGQWGEFEEEALKKLKKQELPYITVVNKTDEKPDWKAPIDAFYVSAETDKGIEDMRWELVKKLRSLGETNPTIIGDIVNAGDFVLLVVPIDLEAPKGRLILPQVMTIRDILDHDAISIVSKERELFSTIRQLGRKPDLVICDSQVVLKVVGDVPSDIRMTTFSIIFAKLKGDLRKFVEGAAIIDKLEDGDKVLISEACSHHTVADDIGGIKIPRWIRQYTGKELHFDKVQGKNYPENLEEYRLIIHCGACMLTPKMMCARIDEADTRSVPITNYGVAISYVHGVLHRVLSPFPYLQEIISYN
ncbi:MAG: [FeFe] hydrogenase H-cluster maturation GTPase HydF [Candidatus Zixiibacteriota bacterium]